MKNEGKLWVIYLLSKEMLNGKPISEELICIVCVCVISVRIFAKEKLWAKLLKIANGRLF